MDTRGFLRSSGITYVGTAVSILCMAAFYAATLRIGPEAFGALQATMALMFLLFAGRGAAASYVVIHAASGDVDLGAAVRSGARLSLLLACAIGGAILLSAPLLRDFLHLGSIAPFCLLAFAAVPGICSGVVEGALNVQRRFAALAASTTLIPIGNLVFAALFLRDGFHANDAGWIILCSQLFSCLNLYFVDRSLLRSTQSLAFRWASLREAGLLLGGALLFGASLRLDILWARHILSPAAAGAYAVAASIAVVAYFVSNGIARVTSVSLRGGADARLIALSYALIGGVSACLALGFAAMGEPLLERIVGRDVAIDWNVLLPLFVALTCMALITFDYACLNVVTKSVHAGIGLILVAAQATALALFGTDPVSIAWTQCGVLILLTTAFSFLLERTLRHRLRPLVAHPTEPHVMIHG